MFIGGTLIRRFDGFRRLCAQAGERIGTSPALSEEEMLLINRGLAGLGGPPASDRVQGVLGDDGLALLLLFLLTQEEPVRIGLIGQTEGVMGRLKALTHLLGHAVWPMLAHQTEPLDYQAVVARLDQTGLQLRPLIHYDAAGEPIGIDPTGGIATLDLGPGQAPYTLVVLLGDGVGSPALAPTGQLAPVILRLAR